MGLIRSATAAATAAAAFYSVQAVSDRYIHTDLGFRVYNLNNFEGLGFY